MSSRWDSLKPSSSSTSQSKSNTESRGDYRSNRQSTSTRSAQPPQQHQSNNSRGKWQPAGSSNTSNNARNVVDRQSAGRQQQGSTWRKAAAAASSNAGRGRNINDQPRATSSSPEWEKLTRDLWDCGTPSNIIDNDKDGMEGVFIATSTIDNDELVLRILQELSSLLEHNNGRTIHGSQRGNALAAALYTLNVTRDSQVMGEILDWSCKLFHLSSSSNSNQSRQHPGGALRMTALQAQTSVTGLLSVHRHHHCCDRSANNDIQNKYHKCCTNVLVHFAPQLPAEETAHQIVGWVLLPSLERLLMSRTRPSGEEASSSTQQQGKEAGDAQALIRQGIQALQSLLTEKNHASALLAPLVNDVGADGNELYLVNPLRKRIFQVLQCGLQKSSSQQLSTTLIGQIHKCLTLALQMATNVDKSSSLLPPASKAKLTPERQQVVVDLDPPVMEKFFKDKLNAHATSDSKTGSQKIQVLDLLHAYLKHQPASSLSLGTILLFRDNPRSSGSDTARNDSICPTCNCRVANPSSPYSPFLSLLHNSNCQEEGGLVMASLAIMVSNIPWKLWLGKKAPQGHHCLQHNSTVSNFSMRVVDTIRSIVLVSKCLLVSRWQCFPGRDNNCSTEPLASLLRTVLLGIPFESCDETSSRGNQRVMKAACGLVETLATNMLQPKTRKTTLLVDSMVEVFEESMGGRLTPQGSRTLMIAPAKSWLSSSSSRLFLDGLFDDISDAARMGTQEKIGAAKTAVKVLRSILGTRPQTVLDNEANWKVFQDTTMLLFSSTALKLSGLLLLESLLQGRKCAPHENASSESSQVVALALSVLPRMVASPSGPCRSVSFQAYGHLLESDWLKQLDEKRDGDMKYHIELILGHCSSAEQVATVRSATCKAIGDICSNCFLEDEELNAASVIASEHLQREELLKNIGGDVCVAMLQAMEDSNATVRSMAIFAVGNLAQVMGRANFNNILNPQALKQACLATYRCLKDENDKVSSNAIRSIGHLGIVVMSGSYAGSLKDLPWDFDEFCHRVILALSEKVSLVPTALSGKHEAGLSWKKRSSIKKHGRVACNSIALLLKHWRFSELSTDDGIVPCQIALRSLLECIECLGTTLDEKVTIAAMLAFRALPSSSLARVSGKSGLVGRALVSCISFLVKEQWSKGFYTSSGRLLLQADLLCEHLIDSAAIADATNVLSCNEIADSWMEQLYEWMVLKNCSARTFGAFALALQTPGIRLPVLVEQKFANRAMNLLRNEDLAHDSDDEL